MARLKNRQMQIPGGLRFYQPQTNFTIKGGVMSFNGIVDNVIANRRANPQHKLATDKAAVEDEVDEFNAAICERMGWTNFIMIPSQAPPAPKFKALSPLDQKQLSAVGGKIKKVWQGVRSLDEWIQSQLPAVDAALAQHRAEVCVACPMNGQGGLEEWFTKPASEAIKKQFAKLSQRQLSTPLDDKLNVCTACLCPLKLLVHTPIEFKLSHMGEDTRQSLHPGCWVLAEEKALKSQPLVDPAKE